MHQLHGLLLADIFIERAAEVIRQVIFSVGKRARAAEAVHDRARRTADAVLDSLPVNGTSALFERLADEMRRRAADASQVVVHDTICRQVSSREQHLQEFARRFDAVVFVCGRKSSNGRVLFEVCRTANPRTCNIEEAAEIDPAWFEGAESVGICGATSTPKWLMQEVADRIGKIGKGK